MEFILRFLQNLKEYQVLGVLLGFVLAFAVFIGNEYLKQRLFTPKIEIDFLPEKPFVIVSSLGDDKEGKYYPFYQFRLSIYNDSGFYKADKHVVMLTELWNFKNGRFEKEEKFEPIRLNPLGYGPETILPKMKVFAPFGKIAHVDFQKRFEKGLLSGNPDEPQFRFEMKDMPRWILSHVAPGKHRFKITVYFENIPPVSKTFELSWSGQWSDDYEKMLKEIVIKPL